MDSPSQLAVKPTDDPIGLEDLEVLGEAGGSKDDAPADHKLLDPAALEASGEGETATPEAGNETERQATGKKGGRGGVSNFTPAESLAAMWAYVAMSEAKA